MFAADLSEQSYAVFCLVNDFAININTLRNETLAKTIYRTVLVPYPTHLHCCFAVLPADSLISWDTHRPVRLRLDGPHGLPDLPPRTVPEILDSVAHKHPDHTAMKIKRFGVWREWSYADTIAEVRTAAAGLLSLGLRRYGGVGILGPNCPEWFVSSAAAIYAGGLSVGIYATNRPEVSPQHT